MAQKWQKGTSGNPGGRSPRVGPNGETLAELAREHTQAAIARVVQIMKSPDPELALKAAQVILDRGWGKPKESVELDAKVKSNAPVINLTVMRAKGAGDDGGA